MNIEGWRDIVDIEKVIKVDKKKKVVETFYNFTVSEVEFYEYGFNTIEWEQEIHIVRWEHDWVDNVYTITYQEIVDVGGTNL